MGIGLELQWHIMVRSVVRRGMLGWRGCSMLGQWGLAARGWDNSSSQRGARGCGGLAYLGSSWTSGEFPGCLGGC
ncbi:hypothetical protein NL676_038792 [Syzygium grande]|nr:hypothetical protein NL676_038792 [Syzygium grande]